LGLEVLVPGTFRAPMDPKGVVGGGLVKGHLLVLVEMLVLIVKALYTAH